MSFGGIGAIIGAIIGVATLSVFLSSSNTASIIKNLFDGLTSSLKAAMGGH